MIPIHDTVLKFTDLSHFLEMNRWLWVGLWIGTCWSCEHHHHEGDHEDERQHHHHIRANGVFSSSSFTSQRDLQETDATDCGVEPLSEEEINADKFRMRLWSLRRGATIFNYTIPTYAHVIQPTANFDIVPDSNVQVYMTYLNKAFAANTPFVFNLMEVTRTVNPIWSNDCRNDTNQVAYKTILKRGGKESLNIYFCNLVPDGPGLLAGFAYYPSQNVGVKDGVVLSRTNPSDLRRPNTLVHETVRDIDAMRTDFPNITAHTFALLGPLSRTASHLFWWMRHRSERHGGGHAAAYIELCTFNTGECRLALQCPLFRCFHVHRYFCRVPSIAKPIRPSGIVAPLYWA
jgi:hypothetical protein